MKISLIISVYKNIPVLKAVLDSLSFQTFSDFEVVISEDGEDAGMKQFIEGYPLLQEYQHLTQSDEGWRKNRALNNAIRKAKGDWLVFIDGDCILHPRFMEMHHKYAAEGRILAGKRVKLNQKSSEWLLKDRVHIHKATCHLLPFFFIPKGTGFPEEAFFIDPNGIFGFIPKVRTLNHLLGSNMSFSRKAIEAINGFDENYTLPAAGEDEDLSWRFDMAGYKHFSLRNLAIQYHIYHQENWTEQTENMNYLNECRSKNLYICKNGLIKK